MEWSQQQEGTVTSRIRLDGWRHRDMKLLWSMKEYVVAGRNNGSGQSSICMRIYIGPHQAV